MIYYTLFANGCQVKMGCQFSVVSKVDSSIASGSVLSTLWDLDQQQRALGGGCLLTWRESPTLYPIAAGA